MTFWVLKKLHIRQRFGKKMSSMRFRDQGWDPLRKIHYFFWLQIKCNKNGIFSALGIAEKNYRIFSDPNLRGGGVRVFFGSESDSKLETPAGRTHGIFLDPDLVPKIIFIIPSAFLEDLTYFLLFVMNIRDPLFFGILKDNPVLDLGSRSQFW